MHMRCASGGFKVTISFLPKREDIEGAHILLNSKE